MALGLSRYVCVRDVLCALDLCLKMGAICIANVLRLFRWQSCVFVFQNWSIRAIVLDGVGLSARVWSGKYWAELGCACVCVHISLYA